MIEETTKAAIRLRVLRDSWSVYAAARHFGIHHSTVRRVLGNSCPQPTGRKPGKLDPHKRAVDELLRQHPKITAARIYRELRSSGFSGSEIIVRRYDTAARKVRSGTQPESPRFRKPRGHTRDQERLGATKGFEKSG